MGNEWREKSYGNVQEVKEPNVKEDCTENPIHAQVRAHAYCRCARTYTQPDQ